MTRVFAILQLCLAFSLILWVLAEPFTGDYFATRSSLLLFQTATGQGNGFLPADKLERHAKRFTELPSNQQRSILAAYARLEQHAQKSFSSKIAQAFKELLIDLPPFTQAWLLFSIAIAILILRRNENVTSAVWLLPIIALCYSIDNFKYGIEARPSVDEALLPTEAHLVSHYLGLPLDGSLSQQREALTTAWQRYLIKEWAHEKPSADPERFKQQVEDGEHALTVARIERRLTVSTESSVAERNPWPLLLLYVLWNCCFAIVVSRSGIRRRGCVQQNPHP